MCPILAHCGNLSLAPCGQILFNICVRKGTIPDIWIQCTMIGVIRENRDIYIQTTQTHVEEPREPPASTNFCHTCPYGVQLFVWSTTTHYLTQNIDSNPVAQH